MVVANGSLLFCHLYNCMLYCLSQINIFFFFFSHHIVVPPPVSRTWQDPYSPSWRWLQTSSGAVEEGRSVGPSAVQASDDVVSNDRITWTSVCPCVHPSVSPALTESSCIPTGSAPRPTFPFRVRRRHPTLPSTPLLMKRCCLLQLLTLIPRTSVYD